MYLKNRDYSYPVLGDGTGSYVSGSFITDFDAITDMEEIVVTMKPTLDSKGLQKLVDEGKAEIVCHVECQKTSFRKIYRTGIQDFSFRIPKGKLNDKTQICGFLVAKEDISGFSCEDFAPEYKGISFPIGRGCFLAIGSQYDFIVEDKLDALRNTSSIFLISEDKQNPDREDIDVDLKEEKIVIKTSQKVKSIYYNMKGKAAFQKIFHSMLVLPALISALQSMKNPEERSDHESRRWFRSLMKVLNEIGITEENIDMIEPLTLAQKIIGNPIYYAMTDEISDSGEEI